ncbi:MAG: RNA degradosome polyphosphate kinase [Actinobacteria bacterium]|nr:RNA degradosome polyphosphate kinase [Actinomycetota bacterium]
MTEHPKDVERFLNRELSSLDFNERVLALAEDSSAPLLERMKFLAIFADALDQFFMVRVAGLMTQQAAGLNARSADGFTARQQLALVHDKANGLVTRHAELFVGEVMPALAEAGACIHRWDDLSDVQRKELDELFYEKIFPIVTPLAVDPGHPFPYISNLSLNLAVLVRDSVADKTRFARIKVPPLLPRFITLTDESGFIPLEDVISANLDRLFPGLEVLEHHSFRVTRNADVEVNDDGAEDLLEQLEQELRKRRFTPAVRLEVEPSMPDYVLDLLMRELELERQEVHAIPGPLDLAKLWDLHEIDRPDLKAESFVPVTHPDLIAPDDEEADVFAVLRRGDVLVHHPYESFTTSVQRFIEQAASDPEVMAIKQTLYRTSGDSPIVDALIEAAESGKQVVVLVEIKARFDERTNINWARALERAGCHVVYGVVGLKTHCKLCLVVRREGDGLNRYVHVGTGNYNASTARSYEDLGLLTADPHIGADVSDLFNSLTGYSRQTNYRSLIVAPYGMRARIVSMIEREAKIASGGDAGRIVLKLNSLVDEAVIDALYEASQAGVEIDLIVRSICALRPGVENLSEGITVRSILGRFLEHSRIFYFRNAGDEQIYVGSADMRHRNLDRRVEVLAHIQSDSLRGRLRSLLELALRDNATTWTLDRDGRWHRVLPAEDEDIVALQHVSVERALQRQ